MAAPRINVMKKINIYLSLLSLPLFLYLGLVLGFLHIIPLKTELHSLIVVGMIFFIYLFFIPHNAAYALQNFDNTREHLEKHISGYLKNFNLEIMGTVKSTGSISSFFESYYKDFRNNNFSSIASSFFPTLGILGTFVSIAISMPNFSVSGSVALEDEVTKLLMGTGTAFYASIYGIFLSIWWILFEKKGISFIDKKIAFFQNRFKQQIWDEDELRHAELQERQQAQKNLVNITQTLTADDYLEKVEKIAKVRYGEIEHLSQKQIDITNMTSGMIQNLLNATEGNLKMQEQIITHSETLKSNMEELLERMERRLDSNDTIVSAFKGEMYNLLSSIERIASEIKMASIRFNETK